MTDDTQPEALRLAEILEGDYCPDWFYEQGVDEVAAELRRQHTRIAELESELEAVGAGGVQALSAAPADIAKLRHLYANLKNGGVRDTAQAKRIADGLLAPIIERLERATPKAAPGGQNTVPAEWLEQAYREGWAACRDAETIGEEAEDWAFGNSTANSRMIDAQQAAPKQEAQEPSRAAKTWCSYVAGMIGCYLNEPDESTKVQAIAGIIERRLWALPTPQPAPDCHHRPPCNECAALAAQGGK